MNLLKISTRIISVLIVSIMLLSTMGCEQKIMHKEKGVKEVTKKEVNKKIIEDNEEHEKEKDIENKNVDEPIEKNETSQKADKENISPIETSTSKQHDSKKEKTVPAQSLPKQSDNIDKQYSVSKEASFMIEGPGVKNAMTFTLSDLKGMSEGLVSDNYFSLGRGVVEEYTEFKGVSLLYLLNKAGLQSNASRVIVKAEDGYTQMFTLDEVKKEDYISQKDPNKKYKMIIAFSEKGKEYDPAKGNPFRLVVGQVGEMDFNKQRWVRYVKTIKVE